MRERFRQFATRIATAAATPWAFALALLVVLGWAMTGPYFGWSNTHSLIINTITTVITFLMQFLLLYTTTRDTRMILLYQRELIEKLEAPRTELVQAETAPDSTLDTLEAEQKAAAGVAEG